MRDAEVANPPSSLPQGPTQMPRLLWRVALGSRIWATPRWVSDGCLLVAPAQGPPRCLDPRSGRTRRSMPLAGIVATPASDGAGIYAATLAGEVIALDWQGSRRWRWPLGQRLEAAVVRHGEVIYVAGDGLVALRTDGEWLWQAPSAMALRQAPSLDAGGELWLGTAEGSVLHIDRRGILRWQGEAGASVDAGIAVGRESVAAANLLGQVTCWSLAGERRWRFVAAGPIVAAPVWRPDGSLVVGDTAGHLWLLDRDGKVIWQRQLPAAIRVAAAVDAGGRIYVGSDDESLYGLAAEGHVLWQMPMGQDLDSRVVLSPDGTLLAAIADGTLAALR